VQTLAGAVAVAAEFLNGGLLIVGAPHPPGRNGLVRHAFDSLGQIHPKGLHRDSIGPVGQPRIQFVLQTDELLDIADAFIGVRLGNILNVHNRNIAEGVGAFGQQTVLFIPLPAVRAEDFGNSRLPAARAGASAKHALQQRPLFGGLIALLDKMLDIAADAAVIIFFQDRQSPGGFDKFQSDLRCRGEGAREGLGGCIRMRNERGGCARLQECVQPIAQADDAVGKTVHRPEHCQILEEYSAPAGLEHSI